MSKTLEDFKINKEKCKFHELGTYGEFCFNHGDFYLNYSSLLTELIHAAGRYCEYYASDLFIIWTGLINRMKTPEFKGEKLVLGFREMGIDKDEKVVMYYNTTPYYYRKIYVIEVEVHGSKIDMYMN